jgi:hypothetical protein
MSAVGGRRVENPQTEYAASHDLWHPSQWARFVWGLCSNLAVQIQILRALAKPAFHDSLRANPSLPFHYLNRNFLVRDITISQRASSLLHHYKRIHSSFPNQTLHEILAGGLTVYENCCDGNCFRVTLGSAGEIYWEGDLSLSLKVNGVVVYVLSFSIIPGSVAGVLADEVVFIARLQGVKGRENEVRLATKSMLDVAPPALLVAALQGIAAAMGINVMAGTCAIRQSSYLPEQDSFFQDAYDDFFATLGATMNSACFFWSLLPVEEKPLPLLRKGHKIRARKKREFKRRVANSVAHAILQIG